MRILVTGGAGFIGSHAVEACLARGHEVEVIDDLSHGKKSNVPSRVPLHVMNICDSQAVDRVFARFRPEVLNHHAAQIDVRKSVADPASDALVNIIGTLGVLQLCVKYSVSKVVFSSTGGAIYGEQDYFPADEEHPTRPVSPYGVSKLAVEKYLHVFHAIHGLQYICLRYANVFGPRQDPLGEAGVVAIFSHQLLSGKRSMINGDGGQTRDYVYVGDVARANALAFEHDGSDTFNIGTGIETDVNRLYELLNRQAGAEMVAEHRLALAGEQRRSCISAAKAAKVLGWKPQVSLEEGLGLSVKAFRAELEKM